MRPGRTIIIAWLLTLCAGLSTAACQPSWVAPQADKTMPVQQSGSDDGKIAIYVTSNGWHAEIALARAELPAGAIPEVGDFPAAPYLSFGWGDAEYYPAPDKSLGMTLNAALLPTPAVVHLAGLPAHPREIFPADEVIEIKLSAEAFRALTGYLGGSFERGGKVRAQAVAPGIYSFSQFYPAKGEFHLFNTCNTWAARGLKLSGLSVTVFGTQSAEDLMAQLRQATLGRRSGDIDGGNARRKALNAVVAVET